MDEYLGIVKLFAGNFAPQNWAVCNGQLMSIAQYSALFAILGTQYGGDGVTTFALPNLQGRVAVGAGNGAGLSPYRPGDTGGAEGVTLQSQQMPAHNHFLMSTTATGDTAKPAGAMIGNATGFIGGGDEVTVLPFTGVTTGSNEPMALTAIGAAGGSQAHENRAPYLGMYYIICVNGLFPSRS